MKRHIAALGGLAALGLLTGCVYDAGYPKVSYENRLADTVVITLEGAGTPNKVVVGGNNSYNELATDECKGTAIVVKTEDGDLVGRVEKPACPDWRLVVNEDGTLDYDEQD
ncbi:hypothetical protein [Cellulomonas soli]|uniref:Lipoprotein n=1 Tax=Cellulomonas soli TaxID=931535 RepID=A0A512PCV8_9CELL|nr:hypothetical protein [Cellulomonas soli]NYI58561.1 hypothetical protein [Cellulomonas soli]GEP68986.1 hypothetical protein CSO01_17010 [Cellulomonas soli]